MCAMLEYLFISMLTNEYTCLLDLDVVFINFPITGYTCACWIPAEGLFLPPLLYLYLDCLTNQISLLSALKCFLRYIYFVYLFRFIFTGTFPFFQVLFQHFPFFRHFPQVLVD